MANEAVIIELLGNGGNPVSFTVADATAIAKGTLMKLTDARLAVATAADNDPFCGIAASAKTANDGQTRIACYTHGIFDLVCTAAAITAGAIVSIGGANLISTAAEADMITGAVVGRALETSSTTETIAVLVNLG